MMLRNAKIRIVAATDERVCFWEGNNSNENGAWVEMPLQELLLQGINDTLLPAFRKNRAKTLLIVPDHWFKHDYFLFKSPKDSLITPFLERKLKTVYPNLPSVSDFFSYVYCQREAESHGVKAFFLHEEKGYRLYDALSRADLLPRWITTPALLWTERLKLILPEFSKQGTLLIQLQDNKAFLYFFFEGDFLFSRAVALADVGERWDALLFEINQSLYLFAQKAKSDLGRIYLIGNEPNVQERLSEGLGRSVQTLAAEWEPAAVPPALASLDGLLAVDGVAPPSESHSIAHRRIQQELKWRPVQWAGILLAGLLCLFLLGEHQWLEWQLQDEITTRTQLRQKQLIALADCEAALDEITEYAKRPASFHTIAKMVASLPEAIFVHEIKLNLDSPLLELAATVNADNIERFRQLLKTLTENVNRRFKLQQPIRIEDIIFNMEDLKNQPGKAHYKIAFKVNLS
jgi:hypothetical protein